MGDFERTFGAGADAANIVGSRAAYHTDSSIERTPQKSPAAANPDLPVRPDGMTSIEWALVSDLQEAAIKTRHETFGEDESPLSHWQLLKIVSRLPARNELDRIPVVRENGWVETFDALISQARRALIERGKCLAEKQPE